MQLTEDELALPSRGLQASQPKPRKRQAKGPVDESLFTMKSFAFSSHMKRIAESENLAWQSKLMEEQNDKGEAEEKEIEKEKEKEKEIESFFQDTHVPVNVTEPIASHNDKITKKKKMPSSSVKGRKKSLRLAKLTPNSSPIESVANFEKKKPCSLIVISSDDDENTAGSNAMIHISEPEFEPGPKRGPMNRSMALFHELEAEYFPEAKSTEKSTTSILAYRQKLLLFPPTQLDRLIPPETITILSNESFEPFFESYRIRHALPDSLVWVAEATRIYAWASPSSLTLITSGQENETGPERPIFHLYAFVDGETWKSYERQFFSQSLSWQDYTLNLEIELAAMAQPVSQRHETLTASDSATDSNRHLRLQLKGPQGNGGTPWIVQVDPFVTTWTSVLENYKAAHASLSTTATSHHSLWFDGERLELDSLISMAGLENDDCIEVHVAANKSFCK